MQNDHGLSPLQSAIEEVRQAHLHRVAAGEMPPFEFIEPLIDAVSTLRSLVRLRLESNIILRDIYRRNRQERAAAGERMVITLQEMRLEHQTLDRA